MKVDTQVKLQFHSVDFKSVDFKSNQPIHGRDNEVSIHIVPKVFYPKDEENHFKIIQEITIKSSEFFTLSILAVGNFELLGEVNDETRSSFVNVNAPAIMFPYIRSFISTLTSNLGNVTGALTIPPQFFKGILEEVIEE